MRDEMEKSEENSDKGNQEAKDAFEPLRDLIREGVPIFHKDLPGLVRDVIRAMYYIAKSQLSNPGMILLHDFGSVGEDIEVTWLAGEDTYDLGDLIACNITTTYHRGTEKDDYHSFISVKANKGGNWLNRLSNDEVLMRWEYMKHFFPQEFKELNEKFDILKWYQAMFM